MAGERLSGWEEIGAYLRRSARTVQRWEKELGLPVRRVETKGGVVIYAEHGELDEWLRTRDPAERADEAVAPSVIELPQPRPRVAAGLSRSRIAWAGGIVALASALSLLLWPREARMLSRIEIAGEILTAVDQHGAELWKHRFPTSLTPPGSEDPSTQALITDIDGDGQAEVLLTTHGRAMFERFYCFNAHGKILFEEPPLSAKQYGEEIHSPPFLTRIMYPVPEASGRKAIWLASAHHLNFPSPVRKLDSAGNLLGEYWSNGTVMTLQTMTLNGRRVLLVGACNNELWGASLAVLDYDHPAGSAPAVNNNYRCKDCPAGTPLDFIVFPRMQLSRDTGSRPFVRRIVEQSHSEFTVEVWQGQRPARDGHRTDAMFQYSFDQSLRLLKAGWGDGYETIREIYPAYQRQEKLAILRWNGHGFTEEVLKP